MNKRIPGELALYLLYIILFLATVRSPFFWDTIQLASKHATYFYTGGFSDLILPNEIDSGHIPSLGLYIALMWKIFGRSLLVSHLAMAPFVIGIVYQTIKLVRKLFDNKWYLVALVIILIDPTLLAQSTLVSPDVILVFFFLLALNSILNGRRILLIISLAGLALISMRGMMCAAGLFAAELFTASLRIRSESGKVIPGELFRVAKDKIILYLPAAIIAVAFLVWHYYRTGWIGYHKNMPWAELFERADLKTAFFNVFILGWRLADFGRLTVLITGAVCLWHYCSRKPRIPENLKMVLTTSCIMLIIYGSTLIGHKNLSGHRYLLPVCLSLAVTILYYLFNVADSRLPKKIFAGLMITGLLTGNFWVYPDKIAKGWDSTLAYLPYFQLRSEMLTFMESAGIKPWETGTGFPNEDKFDYISLNGNMSSFAVRDLQSNRFIFWSNIYNDFSDSELESLTRWEKVKELKSVQVRIILFKNPELK